MWYDSRVIVLFEIQIPHGIFRITYTESSFPFFRGKKGCLTGLGMFFKITPTWSFFLFHLQLHHIAKYSSAPASLPLGGACNQGRGTGWSRRSQGISAFFWWLDMVRKEEQCGLSEHMIMESRFWPDHQLKSRNIFFSCHFQLNLYYSWICGSYGCYFEQIILAFLVLVLQEPVNSAYICSPEF